MPDRFALHANYPNPFNPTTSIRYDLPVEAMVDLVVYDVVGRQLAVLIDRVVSTGQHTVTWNADTFPSGLYFYRLQAGDYVETKRMVVVK